MFAEDILAKQELVRCGPCLVHCHTFGITWEAQQDDAEAWQRVAGAPRQSFVRLPRRQRENTGKKL